MIYLKYSRPGSEEKDLATAAHTVNIGTAPSNTIQLDGPAILAQHAQIDAKSLRVTSPVPISVNDTPTENHALENGDIITIGDWTFRFFHTGDEYADHRDTRTIKVNSSHNTRPH